MNNVSTWNPHYVHPLGIDWEHELERRVLYISSGPDHLAVTYKYQQLTKKRFFLRHESDILYGFDRQTDGFLAVLSSAAVTQILDTKDVLIRGLELEVQGLRRDNLSLGALRERFGVLNSVALPLADPLQEWR